MDTSRLVQGSPEWREARAGSLGASQIADALAKTRSGWGASRENLQSILAIERLTGKPVEGFVSQAMLNGIEREQQARAAYEFLTDCEVLQIGLVPHPRIARTHASPDGLVGASGVLEIKSPEPKAHIEFLLSGVIPQRYSLQMQWQLCCCEREWVDFVSWHPDFPAEMQLFVRRVQRDDAMIATLEKEVAEFLAEVADKVAKLTAKYSTKAAA